MALAQEDFERLGDYVKSHIGDWLAEQSLGKPAVVYEIELRERMVRVEEELRHQRELMREGFAQIDKRFEQVEKRFEQMDKRFEAMQKAMDQRFEAMQKSMDQRFEQVDKRFESVQQDIRGLQTRMDHFMRWSFGVTVASAGLVISVLKFWPV